MSPTDLATMIGSLVVTAVSVSWYLGTRIKAPLDMVSQRLEQVTKEHGEIWVELRHARSERADLWQARAKMGERITAIEASTRGN
tara:strand:+ start:280 stop:534 length:255 start_codon:yes stop_codon:yes gene_type:complete